VSRLQGLFLTVDDLKGQMATTYGQGPRSGGGGGGGGYGGGNAAVRPQPPFSQQAMNMRPSTNSQSQ